MATLIQTEHADEDSSKVKLGFVEEVDRRLLSSKFFPSKVGGRPAWLSLNPVPEPKSVQCGNCGGPTIFLIQVYAPLKTDDTFHRTLFIFVCTREACVKQNCNKMFRVLRSQLPLKNSFYSDIPPNEEFDSDVEDEDCQKDSSPHVQDFHTVCHICGVKSSKKCAKCKEVYYCTKEHQTLDWKFEHKKICSKNHQQQTQAEGEGVKQRDSVLDDDHGHGALFKEYDLVTETEDLTAESSKRKTDGERWEEYKTVMQVSKMKGLVDGDKYTEDELEKAATGETEDDKHFLRFKKRIDIEPTQVLRYCRGGEPLWVSAFHKPILENVPNCDCGAKRIFEFQIMPQLLNYLKVESLDWGTLCVYTCSESCRINNSYQHEFIWKQDFHDEKENDKQKT